MKYPQIKNGQLVQPRMKGYKMACCDCGLVHKMNFFVVKHGRGFKVRLKAWRDNRATASMRRGFAGIRFIKNGKRVRGKRKEV